MKKILIPIGTLLLSGVVHAQLSSSENYVYSKKYLDYNGTSATKSSETVQYFDGLGRPKQIVNVKASPLGKDVVTPITYDQFGRQVQDYLPVPQGGTLNGAITPDPLSNLGSTPYGTEKIYSEKVLENSPLDRIQQQIQVGNDWNTKTVKFGYETNTTADNVRKFATSTSWANEATLSAISNNGMYAGSQLYKNTVTDEDENKTIEFKNGKGQVLLVRKVISTTENADTYYVYNEYDQLAFILPPLLSKLASWGMSEHDALAYQYRYDGKGRLVEKKLPGKGWEYMVYDKQDRLVAIQDAKLREQNQWLYTKYDQFGRVAFTGIATGSSRNTEQALADSFVGNNVKRTNFVFFNREGMDVYYDPNGTYPNTSWVKLLSVNYYDSYPGYSFNPAFPSAILGENTLTDNPANTERSTKGLPVMSFVKNIEDDNWTKNYTYYDTKGRSIGTYSINHLGGYTKTESKLDFAGALQNTNTYHLRKTGEIGVTVKERFVYDHQNRILQHYHQVDSQPEQLLADNTYNEISQLTNKKVGNSLQSIDYAYNIRGWMTDINKNQMSLADLGGKLFSYKIKYNQKDGIENPDQGLFPGKNVSPKYNGNIAEVDWRSVEIPGVYPSLTPKRYGYAYDALNRLTAGYYQNPNNQYSKENTESLSYDLNGNISGLYRTSVMENGSSTATVIDNLAYTYLGNQAIQIKDNSGNHTGYEGTAGNPIEYDANGNMKSMIDKQITSISYNHLNLPNTIVIDAGQIVSMIKMGYRADGTKLRKESSKISIGFAGTDVATVVTDYLDGFQYSKTTSNSSGGESPVLMLSSRAFEPQAFTPIEVFDPPFLDAKNLELQFFSTSEGFYDYQKNQYIYQYKDHLGNVRVSYGRNSAGALEIVDNNDYYPFGMNHLKTGNSYFAPGSYKAYKYNGKELQETGMYDYGARMYMSDLGRWGVVDPLAEKYLNISPYNYTANNPVLYIDPDGRAVIGSGDNITYTEDDAKSAYLQLKNSMQASKPTDDITVNGKGLISNILRNGQSNRFFDERGKQLYFNDSQHDDKYMLSQNFNVGDRLYFPISFSDLNSQVTGVFHNNQLILMNSLGSIGSKFNSYVDMFLNSYNFGAGKGSDFTYNFLVPLLQSNNVGVTNENMQDKFIPNAFFRFGSVNMVYNTFDAGNFMWGAWTKYTGLSSESALWGARLNEFGSDSPRDQNAIWRGHKYFYKGTYKK